MKPEQMTGYGLAQELRRVRTHIPGVMAEAAKRLEEQDRAALASPAPVQAEPVARDGWKLPIWTVKKQDDLGTILDEHGARITTSYGAEARAVVNAHNLIVLALAASPTQPRPQPLTEEQIASIVREASKGAATRRDGTTSIRIARAIEAAHGIKPAQEPTE